jgi:superfamily II DNA/RNA helicase
MSIETKMQQARRILKEHWGHDDFRPAQTEILKYLFAGKDVLGILPTSAGKSACFQVPAMMSEGTCMVVSPLISLMHDQVADCNRRNIPASFINSHVDLDEQAKRFRLLLKGKYKLFYIAPERINSAEFRKILPAVDVSLWATDEAHSASLYSEGFRPAYARIKELVKMTERPCAACRGRGKDKDSGKQCADCDGTGNSHPSMLAVTATATKAIETDICKALGMRTEYARVVGDPIRENLSYDIRYGSMFPQLGMLVKEFDLTKGRYLIYSVTRKSVEAIAPFVVEKLDARMPKGKSILPPGMPSNADAIVGIYHGGLTPNERTTIQDAFKANRIRIVVATSAFGMGIDVPDIRMIVHAGVTDSIEKFVQEIGRAGRDGKPGETILIHDTEMLGAIRFLLDLNNPPYHVFEDVWQYLHKNLAADEILRETGETIAMNLQSEHRTRYSGGQILTVLSMMEKAKLVERASGGATININFVRAKLEEYAKTNKPKAPSTRIARVILDDAEHANHMNLDPQGLEDQTGLSEESVDTGLDRLEEKGLIERLPHFLGKTTRILMHGVPLAEHISRQAIEEKRKREQDRFQAMLDYTRTSDRREFIRRYFLSAVASVPKANREDIKGQMQLF